MNSRPSNRVYTLAIYSYNIYRLYTENPEEGTGGAELQLQELASRLRRRGVEVVYLVGDFGQPDEECRDGVRFVKVVSRRNNHPASKLRFLWEGIRKAKANVILERGASGLTFWLSLICLLSGRRFVFCGASDVNFARGAVDPVFSSRPARWLFLMGLRLASTIVVQKESQRTLVASSLGRSSVVIHNFLPPDRAVDPAGERYDVIWIGNIIAYKRPETVFRLADDLGEFRFAMIGGAREEGYFSHIRDQAAQHPNLEFIGFVPASGIGSFIRRSKVLINTTVVSGKYEEGFPNTFLQAWAAAIPVVSLHTNPDGILGRHSIGRCSGSIGQMALDIQELLHDDDLRLKMGNLGSAYVHEYHDNDAIEASFLKLIVIPPSIVDHA